MKITSRFLGSASLVVYAATCAMSSVANAVEADSEVGLFFEEILVTATKKSSAQALQDVPVAVTAFGERQLDAMHFKGIGDLSYKIPNVSFDDIGTSRGMANFSIRGLGINSSIPSIDPTVGVFIDGMYMGIIEGVLFDQFDLSSVEVLRGPQGLLFGRNVTGGAVLLNTTRPDFDETSGRVKVSYASGDDITAAGLVTGPLSDTVAFKLAGYYNNDGGYFHNLANNNKNFGKAETYIMRGALAVRPSDQSEILLRYEHGDSEGDGPAAQNHGLYSRNSFDFEVDEEGFYTLKWDMASAEINVDFENGTLTNLTAWRKSKNDRFGDLDATAAFLFHAPAATDAEQFSNELRYAGRIADRADITIGAFYFDQTIDYFERRQIFAGAVDISGGGKQEQSTKALFASVDFDINDKLSLIGGLRYTEEKKSVEIATIRAGGCNNDTRECTANFFDDKKWTSLTPKIGLQYQHDDLMQVYAFWTKGFRSGGYNLRNTSPAASPGPFDEEVNSVFEIGLKRDNADKTLRTNVAFFHNTVSDMQREVNLPSGSSGLVQIIDNTADAKIYGLEAELQAQLLPSLTFTSSLGLIGSKYTDVRFDISSDGIVNDEDKALKLPRLAPVTYGFGLLFDTDLPSGNNLSASINFNHRDASYYTDNNKGFLNNGNMLDANITVEFMEGALAVSVYGKNILNEPTFGGDSQLPFGPGHTISPLNKGEVYGLELIYNF